jgi:DNA-binding beta-propeller fold protein YncE
MTIVPQNIPQVPSDDLPLSASAQNIDVAQKGTKVGWGFLMRWTCAYTIGQVVALIILLVVDTMFMRAFYRLFGGDVTSRPIEAVYALLSWTLYGTIVGSIQWLVLRNWMSQAISWIAATAVGYALGGAAVALIGVPPFDDANVRFGFLGIVLGTGVGSIQQLVLLRRLGRSNFWVLINSVCGIGLGFMAPFMGGFSMVLLPVVGAVSGLASGLLTGAGLIWLFNRPAPPVTLALFPAIVITDIARNFWLRWVGANAVAQALGLGALLTVNVALREAYIGTLYHSAPQVAQSIRMTYALLTWSVFGAIVGGLQWHVLRRQIGLSRWWLVVTLIGSAIGGVATNVVDQQLFQKGWNSISSGLTLGILFGAIVGSLQGLVLRRHTADFGKWIIANSVAGMLFGLVLPMMGSLSPTTVPLFGIVSGTLGGVITAFTLIFLLKRPPRIIQVSALSAFIGFSLLVGIMICGSSRANAVATQPSSLARWTQSMDSVRIFKGHTASVTSVAFSPDGRYVLTGSHDLTARLWDATSGMEVRQFIGHSEGVTGVAFSPDGRYVLTGSHDLTARFWDATSGLEIRRFTGHTAAVTSVVGSPDGKLVLTGSLDNTAILWDISTGNQLHQFIGQHGPVRAVAFSPDSKYILMGNGDIMRLWDIVGTELRQFQDPGMHNVTAIAFSPDGNYVLSSSIDTSVRLWDAATDEKLYEYREFGANGPVYSVAFSPDGRSFVTSNYDYTASLWNAREHRVHKFWGHEGIVYSVAFSPDGEYILTGSKDQTVRLWVVAMVR